MSTIIEIMAALDSAKLEIKSIVSAAKESAPKGLKLPYGQNAQFLASSKVATALLAGVRAKGYVEASSRFSKSGDFVVTYRKAQTLEARVASYVNSRERRKAEREARKAAAAMQKLAA